MQYVKARNGCLFSWAWPPPEGLAVITTGAGPVRMIASGAALL
jgi:hypothetical protein